MHLSANLLGTLITTATCESVNTTQEYNLKTRLKPHQSGKKRFDKLYLYTWFGAKNSNVVVCESAKDEYCPKAFLSSVANSTVADGDSQHFSVGTDHSYVMTIMAEAPYSDAAWQSVGLRDDMSGYTTSSPDAIENGFFINSTGLQWTSTPGKAGTPEDSFGGWLVCDWWYTFPQLFSRNKHYNDRSIPKSCAEVYLMPKYI
ncbi:hypothetical protein LTR17_024651 [Elasticomyces elasticus]|nr:hypothetical protein LTR17_024651 [Elasticomyces elasticus]